MPDSIEFQMTILLGVSLVGHILSSLVRLPTVVGQIIAGLIIGPSLLGIILTSLLTPLVVPIVFRTMTYRH